MSSTSSSSTFFRRTRDAEAELQLPAGFRFHPTDEELVLHYLRRRATNLPLPVPIIAEVDIYKHDPWELPALAMFGTKEWYFFTPRDRKYPNGSRPNRAAGSGYWKATGADKPVTPAGEGRAMGIKKALVFYAGKAPRGMKTNWIMHEYRLTGVSRDPKAARGSNNSHNGAGSLRLDDWVLCRLYNKKNNWEKEAQQFLQMRSHMELVPEPSSSVAAADSGDCSHRTPESDVDNEASFAEIDEPQYPLQQASPSVEFGFAHHQQPHPHAYPQQQQPHPQQQQHPVFGGVVKEEQTTATNYFYGNTAAAPVANNAATTTATPTTNDWYLDLKLDDLQSPFPAFGQPGQDLFLSPTSSSFQDWFFSSGSLNSPMLPRTASQISLLNF